MIEILLFSYYNSKILNFPSDFLEDLKRNEYIDHIFLN